VASKRQEVQGLSEARDNYPTYKVDPAAVALRQERYKTTYLYNSPPPERKPKLHRKDD